MTGRELYEEVCSRLLYVTKAAWRRWEDLAPEEQDIWNNEAQRRGHE